MMKLFLNIITCSILVSSATASEDHDRAKPQTSLPKTHKEAQTRYILNQATKYEAEALAKKERKAAARKYQEERVAAKNQARQDNLKRMSQQEYMSAESQKYMNVFVPFVAILNRGQRPEIPDILKPRTAIGISHCQGMIFLDLKGYSSTCKSYVQDLIAEFVDEKLKAKSPSTCSIHEAIYFERNKDQLIHVLTKWLDKKLNDYQKEAEAANNYRRKLKEFIGEGLTTVTEGTGIFLHEVDSLATHTMSDAQFAAMLHLGQAPQLTLLEKHDFEACLAMIKNLQIIPVRVSTKNLLQVANFQGVQY